MLDGMGRDEMRAADADRQAVADRLRVALDEGRLDLNEYDERLGRTYAAKTYGDLDRLLVDLPAVPRPRVPAEPVVQTEHVTAHWIAQVWSGWVPAVLITTAIWSTTSIASGDPQYFWPIWVAAPWGAVLLWTTIIGLATGRPRRAAEERARKEFAKQQRRERQAMEAEMIARRELPPKGDLSE